jgi:hypothetical protein
MKIILNIEMPKNIKLRSGDESIALAASDVPTVNNS